MALHTQLPIYRKARELLDLATDVTRNIPRDFKRQLGEKVRDECLEIMILIYRANVHRNKVPHIDDLLERLQIVELIMRLSKDKHLISRNQYARVIEITVNIGKQAGGWKRKFANAPAA